MRSNLKINIDCSRLVLRNFTTKDINNDYVKALQDYEVLKFTEARHRKWDISAIKKYVIDNEKNQEKCLIGIFLKNIEDNAHIGNIRLSAINYIHSRLDLGIMIHKKEYWGKGYATEALKCITEYLLNNHVVHRICADYYSINDASAKIFSNAGFVIEGVFVDHFKFGDNYIDSVRVAKCGMK